MSISFLNLNSSPKITDTQWVHDCFMLKRDSIHAAAYKAMMLSPADRKFADTRVGGNIAINNPPAYTRFADPRSTGQNGISDRYRSVGMGEYWSQQIDDNSQIIHIQFGVPTYRGMLSFFAGASNIEAGLLARTGRKSPAFFIGKMVGFVVGLRLLPFILAGTVIKFLMNRTGSRYYNLKPAMHPYWNRVNFIANALAVSEGLVDRLAKSGEDRYANFDASAEEALEKSNTALEPSQAAGVREVVKAAHAACPELFLEGGGVDVYRIASRYQQLANERRKFLENLGKETDDKQLLNKILEYQYAKKVPFNGYKELSEFSDKYYSSEYGQSDFGEGVDNFAKAAASQAEALAGAMEGSYTQPTDTDAQGTGGTDQSVPNAGQGGMEAAAAANATVPTMNNAIVRAGKDENDKGEVKEGWFKTWWNKVAEDGRAAIIDGAFSWVAFRVNATGAMSASFSNSTSTPEIKSTINSFSSSAAKMRFNFSQGATGIPGLDTITSTLKETMLGFAAGLDIMGLVSLAGSSFIDIPDTWEDSSASLPTESYDIHLRSPYGNTLSRYINLHIPLSMWLAGALPISTGRQTYTSPFICKLISVGRSNMDLAMIDSLSVTHGVGNLGFTRDGKPLGIDLSITFKDLNRSVHAPIDTGGSLLNPLNAMSIFDDDNNFNYYLNTLAGVSVADQTIATRRLDRNIRAKMMAYDSFFSTGHLMLATGESAPGRFLRSAASGLSILPGGLFANIAPGMNRIQ